MQNSRGNKHKRNQKNKLHRTKKVLKGWKMSKVDKVNLEKSFLNSKFQTKETPLSNFSKYL